jgi:hypothetical protein
MDEGEEAGEREAEATAVDATIVSHHFWPPLQEEELQVGGDERVCVCVSMPVCVGGDCDIRNTCVHTQTNTTQTIYQPKQ